MSFESMKLDELKTVAEGFGVESETVRTKKSLLALLDDEGVTFDLYEKFFSAEKDEPDEHLDNFQLQTQQLNIPEPSSVTVLVKMERFNGMYQTNGFTFTRQHPYVAMADWQAQRIFDEEEGFRPATPKEIQEYYS